MSKLKDGFWKDKGILSDSYVLLAAGGHHSWGNASGDIPISNGTLCVNLNADKIDGYDLSQLYWANLNVQTSLSTDTTPQFGRVGIGTAYKTGGDGLLNFPRDNVAINFRQDSGCYSKIEYMSLGNEALVFANQYPYSSFIFKNNLNLTNTNDWQESNLGTPAVQIKYSSLYINKAIGNGVTPDYNFYVNGNSYLNGRLITSYAASNGTAAAEFNIGDASYAYGIDVQSTQSDGNTSVSFLFGRNHSTNNQLSGLFYYAGNNSSSNRFGFGFYGNDNILNIRADGNIGLGTTSPSQRLHVSGNQYITGYINLNDNGYLASGRSSSFTYGYSFSLGDAGKSMGLYSGADGEEGGLVVSPDTCIVYNSSDTGHNFSVYDKDLGGDLTTSTSLTFDIIGNGDYRAWSRGGFYKNGSSDSYVLLGAGGHKLESSLDVSNADTVDGYHASQLWRSDGAIWNPGANVTLNASDNSQEWSFDIYRNGYSSCYWHVWDSSLGTLFAVYPDDGHTWTYGQSQANGFYHRSYGSSNYFLTSDGGARYWPDLYDDRYYRHFWTTNLDPGLGNGHLWRGYGTGMSTQSGLYGNWCHIWSSGWDDNTWWVSQILVPTADGWDGNHMAYRTLHGSAYSWRLLLDNLGGWISWNYPIRFEGPNQSVYARLQYSSTSISGLTMHGGGQDYAFYIDSNGYSGAGDTGGLAIDNDGVTVFGAGDDGKVFRVINEDSVGDGPQFLVTKSSGTVSKYTFSTTNGIILQQSNNSWLSPARVQIGRIDTSSYSDRSCIGTTDGNLHIDCYSGHGLYLNYYCNGTIYFNGSSYWVNTSGQTNMSAAHLLINGSTWWSNWYWSGQSGQPTWLWGSNDGTNMYVWNPSNFRVSNADMVDDLHETAFQRAVYTTQRDFSSGTLIYTDIWYNDWSGDPFYIKIEGNTYGRTHSCFTQAQGYLWDNGIINYSVSHLGFQRVEELIAMNLDGYLCFWFPRQSYWEGYSITVNSAYNYRVNRVTNVVDSGDPGGSKRVNLSNNTWHSLYSSYGAIAGFRNEGSGNRAYYWGFDGGGSETYAVHWTNLYSGHVPWTGVYDQMHGGNEFNIVDSGYGYDSFWINYTTRNARDGNASVYNYYLGNAHGGWTDTWMHMGHIHSSGRGYFDEWIEFSGSSGLYWPNAYGSHFFPNPYSTYGNLTILGSKNNYAGIHFGNSTNYMTIMDNGSDKGFYQEGYRWPFYYSRSSDSVGIFDSSIDLGYNVQINGRTGIKVNSYPSLHLYRTDSGETTMYYSNSSCGWAVGINPWGIGAGNFGIGVYSGTGSSTWCFMIDGNRYCYTRSYLNLGGGHEGNASSPPYVLGFNGSDTYVRSYQTAYLSVNYATTAGSATNAVNLLPENTPHYFRDPGNGSWRGGMFWGSAGAEAMSFVVGPNGTRIQLISGSDIAGWNSSTWQSVTPQLQVCPGGVLIGGAGTDSPSQKLDVNGSIILRQYSNQRQAGIIGYYDYTRAAAIWSMGESYQIASDGTNLGSLYGAAYAYENQGGIGYLAGGHQFVWADNGNPRVALGYNGVWAKEKVIAESNSARVIARAASDSSYHLTLEANWDWSWPWAISAYGCTVMRGYSGTSYINLGVSGQNVGIGTDTPAQKLHVSDGLIRVTNNGQTLTMGSANAYWCHFESTVDFYFGNQACFAGHVYPHSNNTYNLGEFGNYWHNVNTYIATVFDHIDMNGHGYLMSGRSTSYNYGYSLSLGDSGNSMGMFSGPGGEEGAVIVSPDTCVIYNSFDQGWGFQLFDKDRGGDLTTDNSRVFGVNQANYFVWSRGGFWKEGSSDSYVLLGGGGHMLISSLGGGSSGINIDSYNDDFYPCGYTNYYGSGITTLKACSSFHVNSAGAYHTSDISLKHDIRDILYSDVIQLFSTENGFIRHYKWNDTNKDSYGFIAQELQEYCPEAVEICKRSGLYTVNYNVAFAKIIGALFKKVKEQDNIIKELQRKMEAI